MGTAGGGGRSTSAYIRTAEPEVLAFLATMDDGTFDIKGPQDGVARTSRLTDWTKQCQYHGIDLNTNLPDRAFPARAMGWSAITQRAVLKGLFSANGGAMPKHARVDLKTTCRELARQVQTMLIALGFSAYITTNKAVDIEWENGVYGI